MRTGVKATFTVRALMKGVWCVAGVVQVIPVLKQFNGLSTEYCLVKSDLKDYKSWFTPIKI